MGHIWPTEPLDPASAVGALAVLVGDGALGVQHSTAARQEGTLPMSHCNWVVERSGSGEKLQQWL